MNLTEDAAHHLVDHAHTRSDYPVASVDTLFIHVGRNRVYTLVQYQQKG